MAHRVEVIRRVSEFLSVWAKLDPIIEEAAERARRVAEEVASLIRERYWSEVERAVREACPDGLMGFELTVELSGNSPLLYVPTLVVKGAFEDPNEVAKKIWKGLGDWASDARLWVVVVRSYACLNNNDCGR